MINTQVHRIILITVIIFLTKITFAQNLVSNGGFENYSSLPSSYHQYFRAIGWSNVNGDTIGPPYGSPDYYNTLGSVETSFGPISPNSGNGQMGFYTYHAFLADSREYISTQLTSQLIPGEEYQVSFFLTNGNGGTYTGTVDNFGIHLSVGPLTQVIDEVIQLSPTIEVPGNISNQNYWQQYIYTFVATSAATHITFGNFEMDSTTTIVGGTRAYYFIDDIELVATSSIQIQGDTSICIGGSTTLLAINDSAFAWADSLSPTIILSTDSTITVAPNITTTYFVYGTNDTTSITVNVYALPVINLGNDTTLCQGEILTLDATTSNATYLWQDNSTNPTFNASQQGTYWTEITVNGCSATDTININYTPLPTFNLGNDTTLCQGEILTLDATTSNATYLWQDNSTNPTFNASQQGTYWTEITVNGCSATDTILIIEEVCEIILELPNVFTPNNDGINDLFLPIISKGIVSMNTIIYNRWGNKIYDTNNLLIEWNGQDVSDGTYFWVVYYTDINGVKNNLKGYVTILK